MKKILAMVLSLALVATLAISGTVAYLTDDESAVNVMTVGKVDILLHEEQRSETGDLEDFEDNKNLMPAVGSAQGPKDDWGMPTPENYVDKIVRVENIGESPAYVRVFIGIPAALEESSTAAGKNILHWNWGNRFDPDKTGAYNSSDANSPYNAQFPAPEFVKAVEIEDLNGKKILYNVYCFTRTEALEADKGDESMTAATLIGVYLDSAVDYCDEDGYYYFGSKDDTDNRITVNGLNSPDSAAYDFDNGIHIPVFAQAVQSEGFDSAADAFAAAFPTMVTPWDDGTMEENMTAGGSVVVNKPTDLQAAIAAAKPGDVVAIAAGEYDEIILQNADGSPKTGITLKGSSGTKVGFLDLNSSSDITIKGITFDASKAQPTYTFKYEKKESGYYANITGSDSAKPAHDITIQNCVFEGTSSQSNFAPIDFEEVGRTSGHAYNVTVDNCNFNCTGINYIRMNYMSNGTVTIINNTFGGGSYGTTHNTMNFTGNSSDLVIAGNKINNWNVEKNAIGTSYQGGKPAIVITNNTFSNSALVGEGGVIELKSNYTADNCSVTISGNTYAGALSGLTDASAPIIKP